MLLHSSPSDVKQLRETTRYVLPRVISAIGVTGRRDSDLGAISQLPQGAELTVCGDGFNDDTVLVEWRGCHFYVFVQDLESGILAHSAVS